jgi:hypothetical protein
MKKYLRFSLVGVCILLLSVVSACGSKTTAVTTPTTPGPNTLSLIKGDITVNANTNYDTSFTVDANMKDVKIQGKFQTFGGAPNVIEAYIMDDATYNNFLKGKEARFLFDSDKLSTGFIDFALTDPGKYHLTFTNWYDITISPAQKVTVNIDLNWVY